MHKKLWFWGFCGFLTALVLGTTVSFLPSRAVGPSVLSGSCIPGSSPAVNLDWTQVSDQNSNSVQRRVDAGSWEWFYQDPLPFSVFSYTDTSVSNGYSYTYRIKTDPQVSSNEFSCDFTSKVSLPVVVTGSASSITTNTASLSGSVNPGGAMTDAWFSYGLSSSNLDKSTPRQSVGADASTKDVRASLSGLSPGTPYYFRLIARNSEGDGVGGVNSFTTVQEAPIAPSPVPSPSPTPTPTPNPILTIIPENQSVAVGSEVLFKAYYDQDGSGPMSKSEVTGNSSWSLSDSAVATYLGSGKYLGKVVGETNINARFGNIDASATLNVFKVAATASTTKPNPVATVPKGGKPIAYTRSVQDVFRSYVTLVGLVNPNGATTHAWFRYGESKSSLDKATTPVSLPAGKTLKSVSLEASIAPNTNYYFRIVAGNSYGLSEGEILEFASAGNPILAVEPDTAEIGIGQKSAFRAYYDSDGSGSAEKEDVTKKVNWVSSDAMILAYEKNGEFIAKNGGDVKITAIYNSSGVVKSIYDLDNLKAQAGVTVLGPADGSGSAGGVPDIVLGDGSVSDTENKSSTTAGGSSQVWFWLLLILIFIIVGGIVAFLIWKKRQE